MPSARRRTDAVDAGDGVADPAIVEIAARAVSLLRDRYFLANRMAVRFAEASILVSIGRNPHGVGVVAALGCAVADLLIAAALRRTGRLALAPRLALDCVDVAAWSLAIGHPADAAALAAAPLAYEAGLWRGKRGLLVPAAIGVVTSVTLRAAGRRLDTAPFLWPTIAVIVGLLVGRHLRQRLAGWRQAAARHAEAAAGQAELAGQNSVAMGADTVVDLLARTTPLLAAYSGHPVSSPLARWKSALAEACSRQATYLGVALIRWQRRHNSASPVLAADVTMRLDEGAGTLLLSSAQTHALERVLDELGLSGAVPVRVARIAPVGQEQVMLVGGRRVVVPPDPGPGTAPLDMGPIALLLGVLTVLCHSLASFDAVPWRVSVPLAGVGCLLAVWAQRRTTRHGPAEHGRVLAVALVWAAADAILSTLTMRNLNTLGLVRLPFLLCLMWIGPLLVLYWRDLGRRARVQAGCAVVAIVTTGIALQPTPVHLHQVLGALVWPAGAVLAATGLRDTLQQDAADLGRRLERQHRRAVAAGFRRGRRLVIELATAAARETRETYLQIKDRLPADVADEVERRLTEVRTRLAELDSPAEDGPTTR